MRRAPLLLSFCALAFVLAACGSTSSPAAATVNGQTITNQDMINELNAYNADPDFLNARQQEFQQAGLSVTGTKPGSFDANFVARALTVDMQFALIRAEVVKRGLKANADCTERARTDLYQNLGSNGGATVNGNASQGESYFSAFNDSYQKILLRQYEDYFLLRSDLAKIPCSTTDSGKAFYDANPDQFTGHCLSIIEAPDQATATTLVSELRGGADFATVAQQQSIDSESAANGGDIGCRLLDTIPSDVGNVVSALQPGQISDPVDNGSGQFVIIKLNSRSIAPYEQVAAQADELAGQAADTQLTNWLQQAQGTARVSVNPQYGTFDPSTFSVIAPGAQSSAPSSTDSSSVDTSTTSPSVASSSPGP